MTSPDGGRVTAASQHRGHADLDREAGFHPELVVEPALLFSEKDRHADGRAENATVADLDIQDSRTSACSARGSADCSLGWSPGPRAPPRYYHSAFGRYAAPSEFHRREMQACVAFLCGSLPTLSIYALEEVVSILILSAQLMISNRS